LLTIGSMDSLNVDMLNTLHWERSKVTTSSTGFLRYVQIHPQLPEFNCSF
jgi:hypothetical protein